MRKIFIIMLAILNLLCITSYADDIAAKINSNNSIVVVEGAPGVEYSGSNVIIMAVNGGVLPQNVKSEDIEYIGYVKVDGYGKFRNRFTVKDGDYSDLKIYVKQGTKNLTDTIISAQFQYDIDLDFAYDVNNKKLNIKTDNICSDGESLYIAAAYNDKRLITVSSNTISIPKLDSQKNIAMDFDAKDADEIRVFAWENISLMKAMRPDAGKHISAKRTVNDIEIPYGTALAIYDDNAIKTAADKLFANLDEASADTSDVYWLYNNGYYLESLTVFRNYMIDRIRAINYTDSIDNRGWYKTNGGYYSKTDAIDVLCGKMSAEEYNAKYKKLTNSASYFQKDYGGYFYEFNTDVDTNIKWLEIPTWFSDTVEYPSDALYYNANNIMPMACRYACTGDEVYLKRYIQILNDYSCNYVDAVNSLVDGMSEDEAQYYAKYTDSRLWRFKLGGYNASARLETAVTPSLTEMRKYRL